MANEELERRIINLIAQDRIYIPISSMDGMLKRRKLQTAIKIGELILPKHSCKRERAYARIEEKDKEKARKIEEAIEEFCKEYPSYGDILKGKIAEKRKKRETYLCFGMNEGKILTAEDYIDVMKDLGFGEVTAKSFYPILIEISRTFQKKREKPERSILIGKIQEPIESLDFD